MSAKAAAYPRPQPGGGEASSPHSYRLLERWRRTLHRRPGAGFCRRPYGSKTAPFTAQLVHSGSGIAAAEWQATKSTVLSATYSRAYFDRVFSTDPSTGTPVGYGFAGSANSNNRAIQEGTFATQSTLWKRAGYGSVQMITQSSYIIRGPSWKRAVFHHQPSAHVIDHLRHRDCVFVKLENRPRSWRAPEPAGRPLPGR